MRVVVVLLLCAAPLAIAQPIVTEVNDVIVVRDTTGSITTPQGFPGLQMSFCKDAYNLMRTVYPDVYDGIVSFSTYEGWMEAENTWQGTYVRSAATGIGRGANPFATGYNGQQLSHCVFMGTLGKVQSFIPGPPPIPDNPDAQTTTFAVFKGLTGVEMLGHEYGHHWLMGVEFDMGDGFGKRDAIRGCEGGPPCTANQHYSGNVLSGSVMYGNCGKQLDGGTWEMAGCPRKYNHLDQYLMGLRAPSEVTPITVLDDGSDEGNPAQPLPTGSTLVVTGRTAYAVGATEVARAMGPRVPAAASAQHCWRVPFVVVLPPGQNTIPPAMLAKVQSYRQRFTQWFPWATDGRGVIETRLHVNGCLAIPPDAGAGDFDAGAPPPGDGGVEPLDAGAPWQDGGELVETDGGGSTTPPVDDPGPSKEDTLVAIDTGKIRPGCGCDTGVVEVGFAWLSVVAMFRATRKRRLE